MYHFATLDPRPIPAADEANDAVFASATGGVYGIEVTVPALAARCSLGNLDPQHTDGRNVAACVEALTCQLPPAGATLVTVRPDADSVLAMAVLTLRMLGMEHEITDAPGFDRIKDVGAADSAPAGPWVRDYSPPAVFGQVNAVAMNHREPIGVRVTTLTNWLTGNGPELPESAPTDHSAIDVRLSNCGRYAVARADGPAGRGAIAAGYRLAPVVIAANEAFSMRGEAPHRKYTVARWNATHVPMDWDGMLAELQALEPGWGGSTSICGSPQGAGSAFTVDQVTAVVERHLA
jgi:hypothetical protein